MTIPVFTGARIAADLIGYAARSAKQAAARIGVIGALVRGSPGLIDLVVWAALGLPQYDAFRPSQSKGEAGAVLGHLQFVTWMSRAQAEVHVTRAVDAGEQHNLIEWTVYLSVFPVSGHGRARPSWPPVRSPPPMAPPDDMWPPRLAG